MFTEIQDVQLVGLEVTPRTPGLEKSFGAAAAHEAMATFLVRFAMDDADKAPRITLRVAAAGDVANLVGEAHRELHRLSRLLVEKTASWT